MSESSRTGDIFPARLRAAREKRDISQDELAKRSGLQPSAISHFETGTRKPSFDNLRRLADALDVTTDYLLGRVTEPEALAGADWLNRASANLNAADREFAEMVIKALDDKAKARKKREK